MVGVLEKVGKRGTVIAAIIIGVIGIYMQYGREMSVVASYVTMHGEMCENDLSICLNKVWNDKEQGAIEDEILKRYTENSFRNIRFSQGMDKTEMLRVNVYLNRRERKKGKEMFHFEYHPCLPEL